MSSLLQIWQSVEPKLNLNFLIIYLKTMASSIVESTTGLPKDVVKIVIEYAIKKGLNEHINMLIEKSSNDRLCRYCFKDFDNTKNNNIYMNWCYFCHNTTFCQRCATYCKNYDCNSIACADCIHNIDTENRKCVNCDMINKKFSSDNDDNRKFIVRQIISQYYAVLKSDIEIPFADFLLGFSD
jgi:hypothetical protein